MQVQLLFFNRVTISVGLLLVCIKRIVYVTMRLNIVRKMDGLIL